jgi:hypothetical protein
VRGNRDEKDLLMGLYDIADELGDKTGAELIPVINTEYAERIEDRPRQITENSPSGSHGYSDISVKRAREAAVVSVENLQMRVLMSSSTQS